MWGGERGLFCLGVILSMMIIKSSNEVGLYVSIITEDCFLSLSVLFYVNLLVVNE